ncbi:hypothetical protein V8B97DRAFT_1877952 [Scleroderma yunnanense]
MEGKILDKLPSLFNMLFLLDHPGFIQRSLPATQGKRKTDIRNWDEFSRTHREDIANVNLLVSLALMHIFSFLAIQTIDNAGLSYLPQQFSYISVLAALASIVMGSAVRIPRLFTNYGTFYFRAMMLILGFLFELFLYSIPFFLLALLSHCVHHAAIFQLVFAVIFGTLVLSCLVGYWLITEPRNDIHTLLSYSQIPR